MDQMFAAKQMIDTYCEKNKCVYLAFMDVKMAYDRMNRRVMWQIYSEHGVQGGAVESFI